jgi:hypothetical protein
MPTGVEEEASSPKAEFLRHCKISTKPMGKESVGPTTVAPRSFEPSHVTSTTPILL